MTEDDRNKTDDDPGAISASRVEPDRADTTEQVAGTGESSQEERERAEVRAAELRSELAITDARRAEEETAKAHESVEDATKQEEKAAQAQQKAEQRAKAAEDEAERKRKHAAETPDSTATASSSVSGVNVASPGIGTNTDPGAAASAARGASASRPGGAAAPASGGVASDRPEILVGAAFAGAFVFAQILKRLVD